MTFYGGGRGCIGWRFAVVHMQVVLVELMRSFHFAMPEGQKISRILCGGLMPYVEGMTDNVVRLPLIITPLTEEQRCR